MRRTTKAIIITGTVWFYLFALMWAGYLFLSFLGLTEPNPLVEIPQVPFIPGFNDNLPTTTWAVSG